MRKKAPAVVPLEDTVVDVFDPAYDAHRLRMQGHPWREVAARTGYGSENEVKMAVRRYLTQAATEIDAAQKRAAMQTQLDRYEAVLLAWWEQGTTRQAVTSVNASTGAVSTAQLMDDKAANIVLKTLGQIDRLYDFAAEDAHAGRAEVIVIGGTPEQYSAGLRAVIEAESPGG